MNQNTNQVAQTGVQKDWITRAGLRAVVTAHETLGHHCGYVAVPEGHPLFGKHYDHAGDIEVHGGLTYSGGEGKYPVEAGGVWWFGYDCAHLGDLIPGAVYTSPEDTFKDLKFNECECESLAEQLAKATGAAP